jgi:CheY-like chemotaxis protein
MSGYLVCQKLKKDEALRAIPLVLTSAEATEETFEKHRTLKARADEYLLKPYEPEALVEKIGELVGLPEEADDAGVYDGEEELVSLEEEIGIGAADGEPELEVPGLDLESLPDEPAAGEPGTALEDDLRLLDDAFDGIATPPAGAQEAAAALDELAGEKPVAVDEVDAAAASLPDEDEAAARAAFGGLDEETEEVLGVLEGDDETLASGLPAGDGARPAPAAEGAPVPAAASVAGAASTSATATSRPTLRGTSAELLRAAGIRLLDDGAAASEPALAPPPPVPAGADADGEELALVRRELDEARAALARVRDDLGGRDGELRDLRRRLESVGRRADDAETGLAQEKARSEAAQEKARAADADAKAARDEARRAADQARAAEDQLAELRRRAEDLERRATDADRRAGDAEARTVNAEKRADDAEIRAAAAEEDARRRGEEAAAAADALARAETLEREADELRTELLVARNEAEGARGEIEKRTGELKKRLGDLEAANAKNEERVVKAYQKIKADERVRDKVRKALAIAAQLLEEGLPAESAAEKERRAAAAREERP